MKSYASRKKQCSKILSLTSELEKVRDELATTKKFVELAQQKQKISEDDCAKAKMELKEVRRAAELEVHNSKDEHIAEFMKSSMFS